MSHPLRGFSTKTASMPSGDLTGSPGPLLVLCGANQPMLEIPSARPGRNLSSGKHNPGVVTPGWQEKEEEVSS